MGRAAYAMMNECRRQFGIMRDAFRKNGMSEADLADPRAWPKAGRREREELPRLRQLRCDPTAGAQKEMVVPAIPAIVVPILVGLVLSVPGVMGLLAGGLTSGFAVAVFMANAGGARTTPRSSSRATARSRPMTSSTARAKAPGPRRDQGRDQGTGRGNGQGRPGDEIVYGKGSDDHKATVVGDTVGDPSGHLGPLAQHPHQAHLDRLGRVRRPRGGVRARHR